MKVPGPANGGGGAGGSFYSSGGAGGAGDGETGSATSGPVDAPTDLTAGCPGGPGNIIDSSADNPNGGAGGGALYLFAGSGIVVDGVLTADGAPGGAGSKTQGGGGGGAGGFVYLETPDVTVALGSDVGVEAIGGGGGGGGDQVGSGSAGSDSTGGQGGPAGGGDGGSGATDTMATAGNGGSGVALCGGGGGGGGFGVIFVKGTIDPDSEAKFRPAPTLAM